MERAGHRGRTGRSWLLALFVAVCLGAAVVPAAAQTDPPVNQTDDYPWLNVRETEVLDLDQDGRFDALRVFGFWFSPVGDTLMIYDHAGDLPAVADWRVAGDFADSTWVFTTGTTNATILIVRFVTEGDGVAAYLWDDQNDDGQVAYTVVGRDVQVTESPFWTTKIWTTGGGWLRPDGGLNYNLHQLFDGCGTCNRLATSESYPPAVMARMRLDGVPDFAVDLTDGDDDGIPDTYIWRMLADVPVAMYGLPRFAVQGNAGNHAPRPPVTPLFWPLLSLGLPADGNYFDSAAFIPMDWSNPRLDVLKVLGYPIEQGYHINSYAYAPLGATTIYANFENPMAYYDVAGDRDGFPELMARIGYGRANDPMMIYGKSNVPLMDVRYSWNLTNAPGLVWTHKVHVAGRYEITERTPIGGVEVQAIPYAEVPGWVMGREWDATTFVASEGRSYLSSEGIYEFGTAAPTYYAGLDATSPFSSLPGIDIGLRGDWRMTPGSPNLYVDPVDRQLHLAGAEGGVWNVDGRRMVRYLNAGGDEMIDGWQVWEDGRLAAQLHRVPGGLVYSDADETVFQEAAIPDAPLRTLPPTDQASWQTLHDAMASQPPAFAPGDLRAMIDQFAGAGPPPVMIAAGSLTDPRLTATGMTFIVDATDAGTRAALTALTGQDPGDGQQVVTRADGRWSVTPVAYRNPVAAISVAAPRALAGTSVTVAIENPGSLDVSDAYIRVLALAPGGSSRARSTYLGDDPLLIDGGGRMTIDLPWIPADEGTWQIQATIYRQSRDPGVTARGGDDVILAQTTTPFAVAPAHRVSPAGMLDAGWIGPYATRVFAIVALLLMAAGSAALVLRPARPRP